MQGTAVASPSSPEQETSPDPLLAVVTSRRERVVRAEIAQLTCLLFAADLGLPLAVLGALADVRPLRRHTGWQWVSRRWHLVRVVIIQSRVDTLVFRHLGEHVVVKVPRRAAMLAAVAVKLRIAHAPTLLQTIPVGSRLPKRGISGTEEPRFGITVTSSLRGSATSAVTLVKSPY